MLLLKSVNVCHTVRSDVLETVVGALRTSRLARHSFIPTEMITCSSGLPEGCEVTLEVVQAMTRDLRQQTLSLQEERERLVSAQRELGKLKHELPLREKKTNTQVRGLRSVLLAGYY
jgi:hypothetical protein